MGRRRRALPAPVREAAVSAADTRLWGVSDSRRRRDDVRSPYHGMSAFGTESDDVHARCLEYEPVRLPGQFYSHTTAAKLWGIPLPSSAPDSPLHVSVQAPRTAPRRSGIVGHCVRVDDRQPFRLHHGLPVESPADTWCRIAALLEFRDLVAAGDFLLSGARTDAGRDAALCTLQDLREAAARHAGDRGAKALAAALPLLRTGVDSRPETHLRLLMVESGLPEPVVAQPVRVSERRTLHPDLAYLEQRVALEYEGDGHRTDRDRWRRDIERREALETAGWRVVRVTADDLYKSPAALVDRVRRILAQRSA